MVDIVKLLVLSNKAVQLNGGIMDDDMEETILEMLRDIHSTCEEILNDS